MKKLCCFLFTICICSFSFPQNPGSDSLFYNMAIANADNCYNSQAGAGAAFYNGLQYSSYIPKTNGHPFFIADSLMNSSIMYQDVLYKNIKIKYDLEQSRLALYDFNNTFLFCPGEEKISYFSIEGHFFENIHLPQFNKTGPAHGFFEKIFSGSNVQVYLKWEKQLFQPVKAEDTLAFYKEYQTWYISKQGLLHEVNGKRGLLKILEDKKQQLKAFIANNKLGTTGSDALKRIVTYYESLQ